MLLGTTSGVVAAQAIVWQSTPEILLDVRANLGGGPDGANRTLAIGADGSTYVAGSIEGRTTDMLLVKVDATGARVWQRTLGGFSNPGAVGVAVAVDSSGAAIVAGNTTTIAGGSHLVVAKWLGNGDLAWQRQVPQTVLEATAALAVDADDNVLVAGFNSADGNPHLAVYSFDSAGTLMWTRAFDEPSSASDVAVDALGNVIVAGDTVAGEALTAKFAVDGTELWVRVLDASAVEIVEALALDAAGNVYIAGSSNDGSGTDQVLLAKYDADGTLQWSSDFDDPVADEGAEDVALEASGGIVVTGYRSSGGSRELLVSRFDALGEHDWSRTVAGFADGRGTAVAIDSGGNVNAVGDGRPVAGTTDVIVARYESAGTLEWIRSHDGGGPAGDYAGAVAIDAAGSIVVAGDLSSASQARDLLIARYEADGDLLSAAKEDVGSARIVGMCDYCRTSAADADGNLVITATGIGTSGTSEIFVVRLSPDGTVAWHRQIDVGDATDAGVSVALDPLGNVLVAGHGGMPVLPGLVTAKFSAAGALAWQRVFAVPPQGHQYEAVSIQSDPSGNVLVAARHAEIAQQKMLAVKYDADGNEQWAREVLGFTRGVVADGSGGSAFAGNGMHVLRLDQAGTILWQDAENFGQSTYSIALDSANDVLVGGGNTDSGGTAKFQVAKFTAGGQFQWRRELAGIGGRAYAVAADAADNLLAVGALDYPGNRAKLATAKYDPSGQLQWLRELETWGTPSGQGPGLALHVVDAVDVIVAGYSQSSAAPGAEMRVARYDATGAVEWDIVHDGPAIGACAYDLAPASSDSVYVVGVEGCPAQNATTNAIRVLKVQDDRFFANGFES